MPYYSWRDVVRDLEPNPSLPAGMSRQSIVGDGGMLCMHEAFPNLNCAPHQHEAEQFSIVLKGRMRFVIGSGDTGARARRGRPHPEQYPALDREPRGVRAGAGRVRAAVGRTSSPGCKRWLRAERAPACPLAGCGSDRSRIRVASGGAGQPLSTRRPEMRVPAGVLDDCIAREPPRGRRGPGGAAPRRSSPASPSPSRCGGTSTARSPPT